jgi:histidinol phosphatase-like enzyme
VFRFPPRRSFEAIGQKSSCQQFPYRLFVVHNQDGLAESAFAKVAANLQRILLSVCAAFCSVF